ncbi:unnamed protein product [Albugo candida]|nr:unnamed protein product [Albugo candida]|eukprot:CCI39770.1 unnamed protein product [Albugo candida]
MYIHTDICLMSLYYSSRFHATQANLVSNPKDIFKYLYQNKIGQHVALFYVGWALVLERLGNHAQAHKIYLKAVQKKAQPSQMLDQKFQDFQRRMSRHWLRMNETGQTQDSETDLANERGVLENLHTFRSLDQNVSISRSNSSQHARNSTNPENPEFLVHEDSIEVTPELTEESDVKWKELGTVKEQDKENVITPTVWNQSGLDNGPEFQASELRAPRVPPTGEALKVYIDDDIAKDKPEVKHPSRRKRSLHQRDDLNPTEEEMLLKRPLKNFDRPSEPQKNIEADRQRSIQELKTARNIPTERPAYDSQSLKTESGAILCFEEIRARNLRGKPCPKYEAQKSLKQRYTTAACANDNRGEMAVVNTFLRPKPLGISNVSDTKLGARKTEDALDRKSWQSKPILTDDTAEDVTINTRVAMADVNEMFCSPKVMCDEVASINFQKKTWEVSRTEPVERKLQFSVYEDSSDNNGAKAETEFQQAQIHHSSQSAFEKAGVNARSKLKKARKPLASRDDIVKKSRLTNRDVMLKLQEKTMDADSSSKTRKEQ